MSVIIVEGPDNAGKSTLVKKLVSVRGGIIINRLGPGTEDEIKSYVARGITVAHTAKLLEPPMNVVYDRHPLVSEEIYGRILRGCSVFEDDWTHWWERLNEKLNPYFIYCRPDLAAIIETLDQRKQMAGVEENIMGIINQYDRFFLQSPWMEEVIVEKRMVIYSFTAEPTADKLIAHLIENGFLCREGMAW